MPASEIAWSQVGPSPAIPVSGFQLQWRSLPTLLVNFSSGASATTNIEVSNSPYAVENPTAAAWNSHDTLKALTASANSTLAGPVVAVRINNTVYASGTIRLGLCQSE